MPKRYPNHPAEPRYCLRCHEFGCEEHSRLLLKYRPPSLSPCDVQIVRMLLGSGALNKEIAYVVGLEESTVKQYIHEMCRKLGLRGRVALASWAFEHFPTTMGGTTPEVQP